MVKFKFRIDRSIYRGFRIRISYSRHNAVVALTEMGSRVYFGQTETDALHFRAFRLRGTGTSKIMAHDCRVYVKDGVEA